MPQPLLHDDMVSMHPEKNINRIHMRTSRILPEEMFRKDAEKGPQTITYYKQLKKKWKVSIAAMIRRSEKLGIITTEEYQNLIRIMQRRGLRKEEPLDDILITASPALLKTSVIMLLQENVFTPAEFMEELSSLPAGSHIGQLSISWLNGNLPEQFLYVANH